MALSSLPVECSALSIIIRDMRQGTRKRHYPADFSISNNKENPEIILEHLNEGQVGIFSLSMCEHDERSSVRGSVECFHVPFSEVTVIITDPSKKFTKQMEELNTLLTHGAVPPSPPPSSDEVREKLLKAVKRGQCDAAEFHARELAQRRAEIPLVLDTRKSSTDDEASASVTAKVVPLTIVIENLATMEDREETVQLSAPERSTLGQLKRLIESATGIERQRQFWFLDRACLPDSYAFGDASPRLNAKSLIYLTIGPKLH